MSEQEYKEQEQKDLEILERIGEQKQLKGEIDWWMLCQMN